MGPHQNSPITVISTNASPNQEMLNSNEKLGKFFGEDTNGVQRSSNGLENGHGSHNQSKVTTRVYKMRYFFLLVSCMTHICQMLVFLCYAPVANFVDKFYGRDTSARLSIAFLVAAVPSSIVALWIGRKFGLRFLILFGVGATAAGTGIRCFSNISSLSADTKTILVMFGQAVGSIGNPFAMFLPTKVAATWFPDSQRALATAVMSVSSPLGILLINLIVPNIILHPDQIPLLNLLTFIPAALLFTVALVGIRRSSPEIPPSCSAATEALPFWVGLMKLFKSKTFWVMFLCLGCGLGLFNALYSLMEQILCPRGYTNQFSGICIVLLIGSGVIGAFVSGIFVDKTKKFELTLKVSVCLCVLFGIGYAILSVQSDLGWALGLCCVLFGWFGMTFYAIGLEMSAECTYPVSETTSAGLIGLSGQLQGVAYIAIITALGKPLSPADMLLQQCTRDGDPDSENVLPKDMGIPMAVFSAIATVMVIVFVTCFHPTYKRINHEKKRQEADSKY